MNKTRLALAALMGVAVLASATACSTRAPADSIILYYKSGAGDDKKFVECIEPGTAGKNPVDDQIFALPTSARNWNVTTDNTGDSQTPIKSGTKPVNNQPGPEVGVYTNTDFFLNTNCKDGQNSPIVQFWERTGRRYEVSGDGENEFNETNWKKMLQQTLVIAQQKALRAETRKYSADDLDANVNGVWNKIEQQVGVLFRQELQAKLGGNNYFCGPEFKRNPDGSVEKVEWTEFVPVEGSETGEVKAVKKSGTCPPVRISITDINFANPAIAEARANVFKAEQDRKAALVAAQADVDVQRKKAEAAGILSNPNVLKQRELDNQGKLIEACKTAAVCVVGSGSAPINVNAGK